MLDAADEVPERGGGRGPQPEGAVDVQPRTGLSRAGGDGLDVVARAGVHLADLRADDRRALVEPEVVDDHSSLVVGADDLGCAHAEQSKRPVDRDVTLGADDDAHRRRAVETAVCELPAERVQHVLTRGCECRDVRHLAAGHERVRHAPGKLEQLAQPLACNLLDDRCRRRRCEQAGVLVPRRRHPVGGERSRQRAAEHEPEPPSAGHARDAGIRIGHELLEHLARVDRLVLQRTHECRTKRVEVDRREHRARVQRLEIVGRELGGPGEQIARIGHLHQPYKRRLASPNALRARSRRRCRADGRRHRAGRRSLGTARVALRRAARRDGPRARDDAQEPREARGEGRGSARRGARARGRRRRARPCRSDGRGGGRGRGREARRLPPRRRRRCRRKRCSRRTRRRSRSPRSRPRRSDPSG